MKKRILLALFVSLLVLPLFGQALDYPKGPITLVCPWGPGGSADLTCRMIASLAPKHMGCNINVVNKPGGNGVVALNELATTVKPDGYTLAITSSGGITTIPLLQETEYSLDSFQYIIGTTSEPLVVIVHKDSDLKSLKDIVDRYNKTKEPITFAMSGINGATYLGTLHMFRNMKVECEVIPYAGGSEALTAVLGGEAEMCVIHPAPAIVMLESGDVRPIAMIFSHRPPSFPNIPTVEEQGYGRVHTEVFRSIIAPNKVDPDIVNWLNAGIQKIFQDPEWANFLKISGLEPTLYLDGDSYVKALKREIMGVWPLIQELKLAKPNVVAPNYMVD